MKRIKKILIVLIICSIIISIILLINARRGNKFDKPDEVEEEYQPILSDKSLETLNVRNRYFVVKGIIEKYYKLLCSLNVKNYTIDDEQADFSREEKQNIIEQQIELKKKSLYCFFDESFKNNKNLKLENMQEVLGTYDDLYVDIQDVKYIETINLAVYFVKGQIIEKESKQINSFTLMLVIDSQNSTFNLYTEDYIKEKKWDNFSKETFELLGYSKIENRTYNKYSYELVSDEKYSNSMFESMINRLKYNTDYSYTLLEKNYRQKKFNNLEEYKEYVKNINTDGVWLNQYNAKKNENNKEFICIDNKGKMWIFLENTVMNYDAVLDTYTIDLPEFIESYNAADSKGKTALNIQKIVDALNDQDYKYVYSKLGDSFKNDKFKTPEEFEQYAKSTFGTNNQLEFIKYTKTSNYSAYKINLRNNNNQVTKTIIMELQEGTDFVFSFNVE